MLVLDKTAALDRMITLAGWQSLPVPELYALRTPTGPPALGSADAGDETAPSHAPPVSANSGRYTAVAAGSGAAR